jgi:hypothetical protein
MNNLEGAGQREGMVLEIRRKFFVNGAPFPKSYSHFSKPFSITYFSPMIPMGN